MAPVTGPFALVVRPLTPRAASARVLGVERRPATAEDRARVAAVGRYAAAYRRHQAETMALYKMARDNLGTLY